MDIINQSIRNIIAFRRADHKEDTFTRWIFSPEPGISSRENKKKGYFIVPFVTVCNVRTAEPRVMTKAIRFKCLDCCAGSAREVGKCDIQDCSLWSYRFGKRPKTAEKHGKLTRRALEA